MALASGLYSTALGGQSNASFASSIALGVNATTTAANQLVVGGNGTPIQSAYIGNGVTNTAPTGFTLNGTGSSTDGTAGAAVTVQGGAGTVGNTSGGALNLNGGAKIGTGTVGNVILQGTNGGKVGIGTTTLGSGVLTIGTNITAATGGLYFGTDTNLYRSAANELRTDGAFRAIGNIIAGSGQRLFLGETSCGAGIDFGNPVDVTLCRSAGGVLRNTGKLQVQGATGTLGGLNLLAGTTDANGIYFGSDTNLYRLTTNTLKTDGNLRVGTIGTGGTSLLCYDGNNQLATCSAAPGAGNYINNSTSLQASSNFNISGSGIIGTNLTVSGTISSPGAGTSSEHFGAGSTAAGNASVAVGNGASSGVAGVAVGSGASVGAGGYGVAIGVSALASHASGSNVAIGSFASATGPYSIALGQGASVSSTGSIAIGDTATSAFGGSIALGRNATTTAANQLVIGGNGTAIQNVFIGNGVTNAAPLGFTLQSTGGLGTDIAGASVTLAGGKGTGAAAGGALLFQTSDPLASGTTTQSLTTKMIITAAGNVGIGTTAPAVNLDVRGTNANLNIGTGTTRLLGVSQTGIGINNGTETAVLGVQSSISFVGTTNTGSFCLLTNNTCKLTVNSAGQIQLAGATTASTGLLLGGDTNLYRSGASTLTTDGAFIAGGNGRRVVLSGGVLDLTRDVGDVTGFRMFQSTAGVQDANPRVHINPQGTINFGAGGATVTDTNLYRIPTVGGLKTDGAFVAAGGLEAKVVNTAATGLRVGVAGDAQSYRLGVTGAGVLSFSDGTLAQDTNLYRSVADTLKTDDNLIVAGNATLQSALGVTGNATVSGSLTISRPAGQSTALLVNAGGTANALFRVRSEPAAGLEWADGIGGAFDTNLYRSAADTLKTDDSLTVGTSLAVTGTSTLTGNVGIGGATNSGIKLNVVSNITDPVTGQRGLTSTTTLTQTAANAFSQFAVDGQLFLNGTGGNTGIIAAVNGTTTYNNAGTGANINGSEFLVNQTGSGGITTARGIYSRVDNNGTSPIVNAYGLQVANNIGTSSTITNNTGILIQALTGTGANYGIQIETPTGGTTNAALYLSGTGGTADSGIRFGTDTTLYRSAANTLQTAGSLGIGGATAAYKLDVRGTTTASQLHIASADVDSGGYLTSSGVSSAVLSGGAAYNGTTWVAKSSLATIMSGTNGAIDFFTNTGLTVGGTFTPTKRVSIASTGTLQLQDNTGGATLGIQFGSSQDTNLYRSGANVLSTGGELRASSNIYAGVGASTQVFLGSNGGNAGIAFGSASDTSLYRSTIDTLQTNSHLVLSGDANQGLSGGGLSDCDTAATSKLLWDVTTNKFSCGTDQDSGSSAIQNGTSPQTANFNITGNGVIGGTLNVSGLSTLGSLTVSGVATFNGTLTVNAAATFNGTLTVNGHIITGNASGTTTAAVNANAGAGATCAVSGSDTVGTITIVAGIGPAAGTQCTITFAAAYGSAPHVVAGPKGAAAAPLQSYSDNASTTTFDLGTALPLVAGSYTFEYIVAQ